MTVDISATDAHISWGSLRVKVFADGADIGAIVALAGNPLIKGFTTNPTLMRKAGVSDYAVFGRELLQVVPDRPISFEVFADSPGEIHEQALKLAAWGDNVYVKVPITTTDGTSTVPLVAELAREGVKVNVTALLTLDQVRAVTPVLAGGPPAYVSVFAGRVADTGRDPLPLMQQALAIATDHPNIEFIWASPRELLNVVQANEIGCHVITVTSDLLAKLPLLGKDLAAYSLETVRMFFDDARASGFTL